MILLSLDFGWQIYGFYAVFRLKSIPYLGLVEMVIIWSWISDVIFFTIVITLMRFSRLHLKHTGFSHYLEVWKRRLEYLFSGPHSRKKESTGVISGIAQEMADFFQDLEFDWAPTDIAAGLLLLKREQKLVRESMEIHGQSMRLQKSSRFKRPRLNTRLHEFQGKQWRQREVKEVAVDINFPSDHSPNFDADHYRHSNFAADRSRQSNGSNMAVVGVSEDPLLNAQNTMINPTKDKCDHMHLTIPIESQNDEQFDVKKENTKLEQPDNFKLETDDTIRGEKKIQQQVQLSLAQEEEADATKRQEPMGQHVQGTTGRKNEADNVSSENTLGLRGLKKRGSILRDSSRDKTMEQVSPAKSVRFQDASIQENASLSNGDLKTPEKDLPLMSESGSPHTASPSFPVRTSIDSAVSELPSDLPPKGPGLVKDDIWDVLHFAHYAEMAYIHFDPDAAHLDLIISKSNKNDLFHSPFMITYDHDWRSIVISIRGTYSTADTLVDLKFDLEPLEKDNNQLLVHSGIFKTAKNIFKYLIQDQVLEKYRVNHFKNYRIVVCGHSLGAVS